MTIYSIRLFMKERITLGKYIWMNYHDDKKSRYAKKMFENFFELFPFLILKQK